MGIRNFFKELISGENDTPSGDEAILDELRRLDAGKSPLNSEEIKNLDEQLAPLLAEDRQDAAFKLAADEMRAENYRNAIYLYRKLAEHFPDLRQDCESQIGLAYYCMGKYNKAIESYIAARVHGADTEWMDTNIWEACRAMYQTSEDLVKQKEPLNLYLTLCPKGSHRQEASELLSEVIAAEERAAGDATPPLA
jgi:tetratricopeptide (TPR) repeat protein